MNLVVLTSSYPYELSGEHTFLEPELPHAVAAFERVFLVPKLCKGPRRPEPPGVTVCEEFARRRARPGPASLVRGLLSGVLREEVRRSGMRLADPRALVRVSRFAWGAELARECLRRLVREHRLERETVFYTYWLDDVAAGLVLLERELPGITLVSRTHGFDLYEERYQPPYLPFRAPLLDRLDAVFPDSERGTAYLRARYPRASAKIETARLGVRAPGFVTAASADESLRIATCSWMLPVKRIELLIRGLALAARGDSRRFEWHHFGEGPLRPVLEQLCRTSLPGNVAWSLPGYPDIEGLMRFYRENPVDLFVNVSESEGTPVSIMEAISCGIPVLATAVGGNVEIVGEENGWLLPADATPEQVAERLRAIASSPEERARRRAGSLRVWTRAYVAETNYRDFMKRLKELARR